MPRADDVKPERWSNILVLYDDGCYSAVWGNYDGSDIRSLGVRWNGENNYAGYPNQGGNALWYNEPEFLTGAILLSLLEKNILDGGSDRKEHIRNIELALKENLTQ